MLGPLLKIDPVAFHLFGWPVRWYGLIIATGIVLAISLAQREFKQRGFDEDFLSDAILWVLPLGFLGARLYYVLFNLPYYLAHPGEIIMIWHGGLALYGGVIAGALTLYFYCQKHFMNPLFMMDLLSPYLLMTQAIGRWGNFMNQEAHGGPVSQAFLTEQLHLPHFIVEGMHIDGQYYQPTFLYESLWNIVGAALIYMLSRRDHSNLKLGETTLLYFIWYGLGRFFIEGLRTDSLMFFSWRVSQLLSLILVVLAIGLWWWGRRTDPLRPTYREYPVPQHLKG